MVKLRDVGDGCAGMVPFSSAEDAWFWTCGALLARHQGSRGGVNGIRRPCEPDDVIVCVERMLQTGQMAPQHARVLGAWGTQGMRPCRRSDGVADLVSWQEAMTLLGAALTKKGIVACGA